MLKYKEGGRQMTTEKGNRNRKKKAKRGKLKTGTKIANKRGSKKGDTKRDEVEK